VQRWGYVAVAIVVGLVLGIVVTLGWRRYRA
jgi:uncharacterized membrane-anchored protein YhcB (DUF1043 family)